MIVAAVAAAAFAPEWASSVGPGIGSQVQPRLVPADYGGYALYPAVSDRFGVGVNRGLGTVDQYEVAQLRAGWYVDWGTQLNPAYPAGLDYVQTVGTSGDTFSPDEATLAAIVAANPGASWIIGNEPDCIWQGNSTPDQYARVYHKVYAFLKARDARCRVSIGGIVQATPLRLQWLDGVLAAYRARYGAPLPVDFWNIHAYVLREERRSWGCDVPPGLSASHGELWEIQDHDRIDLVAQQIVRFRRWMRDHGERGKELIVGEYGILMLDDLGFDERRVQTFMRSTFDYFLTAVDPELGCPGDGNRLVQRWAWYSLNDRRFEEHTSHSHLFDPATREMTALGHDYVAYVGPLYSPYVDLVPEGMSFSMPMAAGSQPVTATQVVTIAAVVRNAGNVDAHDVSVQCWVGDPSHSLGDRQSISVLAARSRAGVSVEWKDVPGGRYVVGVTVDGDGQIAESDETNNGYAQELLVPRYAARLPIVGQGR